MRFPAKEIFKWFSKKQQQYSILSASSYNWMWGENGDGLLFAWQLLYRCPARSLAREEVASVVCFMLHALLATGE